MSVTLEVKKELQSVSNNLQAIFDNFQTFDGSEKQCIRLNHWVTEAEQLHRKRSIVPIDSENSISVFREAQNMILARYQNMEKLIEKQQLVDMELEKITKNGMMRLMELAVTDYVDLDLRCQQLLEATKDEETKREQVLREQQVNYSLDISFYLNFHTMFEKLEQQGKIKSIPATNK